MFLAFGVFIFSCSITHFMEVWTTWHATYWLWVTAKDLTEEDRLRLNGYVQYIVDKGSHNQEDLLREVADRIASCLAEVA
jgi:hypothetical protein